MDLLACIYPPKTVNRVTNVHYYRLLSVSARQSVKRSTTATTQWEIAGSSRFFAVRGQYRSVDAAPHSIASKWIRDDCINAIARRTRSMTNSIFNFVSALDSIDCQSTRSTCKRNNEQQGSCRPTKFDDQPKMCVVEQRKASRKKKKLKKIRRYTSLSVCNHLFE